MYHTWHSAVFQNHPKIDPFNVITFHLKSLQKTGKHSCKIVELDNSEEHAMEEEIGGAHSCKIVKLNNSEEQAMEEEIGGMCSCKIDKLNNSKEHAMEEEEIGGVCSCKIIELNNSEEHAMEEEISGTHGWVWQLCLLVWGGPDGSRKGV